MKEKRVVITGLGPICSLGFHKETLWKRIVEQDIEVKRVDLALDAELWDSFLAHKIEGFDIERFGITQSVLEELKNWKAGRTDRDLNYALAAVKVALDDSGLNYNKEDNHIGLFLSIEHPGFEPFCQGIIQEALAYFKNNFSLKNASPKDVYKHLYDKFVDYGYDLQTFMYLYLISRAFGLHGYSLFTSNACASGLFAIDAASQQIKSGTINAAIVAGGDDVCTLFKHIWFKDRGLYAEDGKIKPFSKNANGIVFGDGYSAIILEDLECALIRKAKIYAEYVGGGFSLEGWKVVYPDINGVFYKRAIKEALKNSEINSSEIDLINPHGVGIRITDQYEARAIADIFGNKTPVSAFKPYVGHNLGGSALIESIILILALQNNAIPACLNCEDFDYRHNINLIQKTQKRELSCVIKLSCGFAGYNGAVVFRKI
ncbi:MAG: hypothetical protein NC923_06545 [Candidatus Omnitrophica bacterium]|nr:hypothetical protein [Candidatus Omnitrophota bacterium]